MAELTAGLEIGRFKVQYIKELTEYNSKLIKIKHEATGLEIVHIYNDDIENLFAYIFRTPVTDNKGISHILEHSTLCGSRAFPVKDPFLSLLKGSMSTFLNAFTGQDSTIYLASSTIPEDFYNLMLVYGDAVFNPLLKPEVFHQEGFHYKLNDKGELQIVGIVYNEMKGNYASAESLVSEWSIRSLFPGNTYGYDSGGDPEAIPHLTYREFIKFYKKYYHPSNCRIFLYGNLDTVEQLEFLEKNFLHPYTGRHKVQSAIRDQKPWIKSRIFKIPYPVKPDSKLDNKCSIVINWRTCAVSDPLELIKLELLSEILFGNVGSPLRKALVESHLGEDLSPASGLEINLKQVVFSAGIRGTEASRVDAVTACILGVLQEILASGLDEKIIEASLHRIEFRKRELHSGNPYGINLLFKVLRGWIHDLEPELTLEFEKWITQLKKLVNEDKIFYKSLINQYLITNNQRSTLIVYPDPAKRTKDNRQLSGLLKIIKNNPLKMKAVKENYRHLKSFQEHQDTPEDIARIPSLQLKDLPKTITHIPSEKISLTGSSALYFHDIHTNNIIYLDFAFDLSSLEAQYYSYLPLFGKVIFSCGLPGLKYDEVANLLSLYTGGINTSLAAETTIDGYRKIYLIVSLKFLAGRFDKALGLLLELLFKADCSDRSRVKDLIIELKNKYKSSIIPNGSYYASMRAAAQLSSTMKIEEQWYGIEQYLFLHERITHLDREMDEHIMRLKTIQDNIFTRNGLLVNACCDKKIFSEVEDTLIKKITGYFPGNGNYTATLKPDKLKATHCPVESIVTSSNVNFVGKALQGTRLGTKENAVESVLTHLLNTGYLWEKIRVQGGAYGASASSYGLQGIYTFSSFRDPHIHSTLEAYKQSLQYIKDNTLRDEELKLAVIGTVGKQEKPLRGARKAYINFKRIICGITDEIRQEQRNRVLQVTPRELKECAALLLEQYDAGTTVIISSKGELDKAARENPALPGKIIDIPV